MSSHLYAVVGAAGCGRGLMPILQQQLQSQGVPADALVFVDDDPKLHGGRVNGQRVLSIEQFLAEPADERHAVIGIADSSVRARLADTLGQAGVRWLHLQHPTVVRMDEVSIGEGACLSPFVTLTNNILIGRHFHANLYSYVEHDCVIGDFVTFAPGVKCNGNVVVEDHAYIGAGAVLRHGKPGEPLVIGRGAVVGMGAVVTKSVAPGVTVVGNPARVLVK